LEIIEVSIDSLIPDPNNARKHDQKNLDAIKGSLAKFGQQTPIVVDDKNVVLKGNGTVEAAKAMGWSTIKTVRSTLETNTDKVAYALADNRSSELAAWDMDVLGSELMSLRDDGFDIGDIGFDDGDFDFDEPGGAKDGLTDDDEIPEVPQNIHGVKRGDIWLLGNHRVMCGDSTSKDDVDRLMVGAKSDICFTSPPYNVGSLNISGNERTKKKYNLFNDNQSESEFLDFILKNLKIMIGSCNEVFYNIGLVENNKRVIVDILSEFRSSFKDIIYWSKSTVAPHIQAGVINNKIEFILCFGDGKRKFKSPQFSQGSYWNVIEGPNASGNEFSKIHKATFPSYLPENIISNFVDPGGSIVDCFMGTGTTLIACEKTGRKCYGMEIDPHYCSVIIERWQNFTGQKAQLCKT